MFTSKYQYKMMLFSRFTDMKTEEEDEEQPDQLGALDLDPTAEIVAWKKTKNQEPGL